MSKPCSICRHPNRAELELSIANGVALSVLERRWSVSRNMLRVHRDAHVEASVLRRLKVDRSAGDAELARLREAESKSVLDHFVYQRARFYASADRAVSYGDDPGERAAMHEAHTITASIARLLGELGAYIKVDNRMEVNITASPQWHAIRVELVRALKPYPDAWRAVVAAIESAEQVSAASTFEHDERVLGSPRGIGAADLITPPSSKSISPANANSGRHSS